MYYPYFRGKQFELITIRELAKLLAERNFVPVIEPVRESLGQLKRALTAVCDADGQAIVVVNPYYGDHQGNGGNIAGFLKEEFGGKKNILAGIILSKDTTVDGVISSYHQYAGHQPVLIHAGFTEPRALAIKLKEGSFEPRNIFIEKQANMLYRKHFTQGERILVRDGFKRQRNADYPLMEEFSDLHVTYKEIGMDGFGDFSVVGDVYSEGGGPAYAVAIHVTFIDSNKDDVMCVYHFVSDTRDTPIDPAGKFAQALKKLIEKLDSGTSHILETQAIREFKELHAKGHFPGLGYIKKLSMKHHIETLASYLP